MKINKLSIFGRSWILVVASVFSNTAVASPLFENTNANFWRINPETGQIDSYSVLQNQWLENFFNSQGQPIYQVTDPDVGLVNQLANSSEPLQDQSDGTYLPAISIAGLGAADYGSIDAPRVNSFAIYPEGGTFTGAIQVTIDIDGELFAGNKSLLLAWGTGEGTGETPNQTTLTESDINSEGVARVSFYYAQARTYELTATLTDVTGNRSVQIDSKSTTYIIDAGGQENRADKDNDGLPDIVEVAIGLNPFEKDWHHDSDGDGWSDFDVWLRGIDPKYLDNQGVPRDTDRDGWSDFDEEQLRGTNYQDLVIRLPSNPDNIDSASTAYIHALNRYQDVPRATSLYAVEYRLNAAVSNMAVPLNGATRVRTHSEIRTISGDRIFDHATLLTPQELAELTPEQRNQIPQRLTLSHHEQSLDVGDIRGLRVPAGKSLVFSVDEAHRFPDESAAPSPSNKIYRLKHWIPKQGHLSPLTFDSAGVEWTTADEWRTAFIHYLKNNLVLSRNIDLAMEDTITTAFVEYLVAQEKVLLSLGDSFVFNSLREQNPTLDYIESQLGLLHQSSLDGAVARIDDLRTTRLSYQFDQARDYLVALPGNHVSDEFLQRQLVRDFALDSDEGYQIRLMLFQQALEEIASDSSISDANEDSDSDTLSNMREVMQVVTGMTVPWDEDTDGDAYSDANDPCELDPTNHCDPNTPVLMVNGSLQAQESGDESNRYLLLTLQLNAPATSTVTLDYLVTSLEGDTALLNIDYTGLNGTVTFMPGQQAVVIQIPLSSDSEKESTESFHLVLSNPQGVALQTDTYELGILDEDTEVLSADASLVSIVGVTLTPHFASHQYFYTATVPADQTQVQLTANTHDDGATMTLNGGPVASGLAYTLTISEGENPFTYQVQSEDGNNTLTYQIIVTREAPESSYFELSELDGYNGDWVNGSDDNQNLGFEITPLGDFNGDGYEDFAVASPAKLDNDGIVGEFYVVFGKQYGLESTMAIDQLVDGTQGFKVYSSAAFRDTRLGSTLSSGDFNNDGLRDILVSAPKYNGTAIGRVIVIYGKSNWSAAAFDVETMTSSDGFYFKGLYEANTRARVNGAQNAGDVNGDNIDDIFIDSSTYEEVGLGRVGRVFVVYGKETWDSVEQQLTDVHGDKGFHISGISNKEQAQFANPAGDVNNDGFADMLVWGRKELNNGTLVGSAFFFYGGSGLTNSDIAGADVTFQVSGHQVASAKGNLDINNDGLSDMVFSVPYAESTQGLANAGRAYVVYGRTFETDMVELNNLTAQQGFVVEGEHEGDQLASQLSTLGGDFNGDGYDDLFLGTDKTGDQEQDRARGYLIFGTDQAFPQPLNVAALNPTQGIAFRGGNYSAIANIFGSGLGDFNGDGFDDLGIALPRESVDGASSNGQINVIYGFMDQ